MRCSTDAAFPDLIVLRSWVWHGSTRKTLGRRCKRIPAREAIISFERDGLVTIVPNRGAFEVELTTQDVRDHFELRGLVMGFAIKACSEWTPKATTSEELEGLTTELCETDIDKCGSLRWRGHQPR